MAKKTWKVTYVGPRDSIEAKGITFKQGVAKTVKDRESVIYFNHKRSFEVEGPHVPAKEGKTGVPATMVVEDDVPAEAETMETQTVPEEFKDMLMKAEQSALK